MKRHWDTRDFVVTYTSPDYAGGEWPNRFGYCRKCGCDMSSFARPKGYGPILHYKSKRNARRLASIGV